MTYLLGLIGVLLAALGYNWTKRRSAEALLQNNDTKDQLNTINQGVAKDQGMVSAEEEKRKAIEASLAQKKGNTDDSLKDLSDFFNTPKH